MPTNLQRDLERVIVEMILREPFYGYFLTFVARDFRDEVETAKIVILPSESILFLFNPDHWQSLAHEDKFDLLLRMAQALIFKDAQFFARSRDKKLATLAWQLHRNQCRKHTDGVTLAQLATHGLILEAGLPARAYYKLLHARTAAPGLQKILQSTSDTDIAKANIDVDGEVTDSVAALIDGLLEDATRRIPESQFSLLPLELRRYVAATIKARAPSYSWRRYMRMFVGTARRSYIKNTMSRRSKRYRTFPGKKVRNRLHVLAAIDTSGSISGDALNAFFSEFDHIRKTGVVIEVAECDASLHKTWVYTGKKPDEVKGGGGTCFDPVVEYAIDTRPDCLVYLTDGHGPKPTRSFRNTLWLVICDGERPAVDHLPGRIAYMEKP